MTQNTAVVYERDRTVDILRGFAITFMVGSHTADYLYLGTHPFWLVLYASMAAPLFVFVVGMMIALSYLRKNHTFLYYLKRGIAVLLMAVFVDVVIWRIYPFISFDILYLIGLSIPLTYLFLKLNRPLQLAIVIGIFLLTPFLQDTLGYVYPSSILFAEVNAQYGFSLTHLLSAGWFPLFPWLGFSLLGALFGSLYYGERSLSYTRTRNLLLVSTLFLIVGSIAIALVPHVPGGGNNYLNFVYAPSLGYIVWSIGVMGLLLLLVRRTQSLKLYRPFELIGMIALLLYVFHLAVIVFGLGPLYWQSLNPLGASAAFGGLMILLTLIAYAVRYMKSKSNWKNKPWVIKFLFGS